MIKTTKKIKRVAFFGDADLPKSSEAYKLAKNTAELVAENDFIVVNGGGPGIMLASTEGAKLVGGKVEVVIIDPKKVPGNYEGTDQTNIDKADKIYVTNKIEERTAKLIEVADAYVVFRGGTGSLAEMAFVWELAKFEFGNHEPVIFVGKEWKAVIKSIEENMNFEAKEKKVVATVDTPEQVLELLKA